MLDDFFLGEYFFGHPADEHISHEFVIFPEEGEDDELEDADVEHNNHQADDDCEKKLFIAESVHLVAVFLIPCLNGVIKEGTNHVQTNVQWYYLIKS